MKALDRKLLRDLWHMRGQALAIAVVLALLLRMFQRACDKGACKHKQGGTG